MLIDWVRYSQEVVEFLNVETLKKIDYGILDLSKIRNHELRKCYYKEFGYVIEADSVCELKELVLAEDRIWYVFDEIMACNYLGSASP